MARGSRQTLRVATRAAVAFLMAMTTVLTGWETAAATSFRFVNTGNPIPANTGYYSSRLNHYEVYMTNCQSPYNWSAKLRETTGGSGAQIRSLSGPCGGTAGNIAMSWWGPDVDTRVWCYNLTTSSKFAECWELYS